MNKVFLLGIVIFFIMLLSGCSLFNKQADPVEIIDAIGALCNEKGLKSGEYDGSKNKTKAECKSDNLKAE